MNHHPEAQDGPVIVHCNDGAGRSGVYVAIDANIELSEEDGVMDVFGYVKKMRTQRRGLVESLEQLKFVYDTLEEFVVCGYTYFPVKDLTSNLKSKGQRKSGVKSNEYEKEYALICNQTPRFTIGDCAAGHRADNRDKNRNVLIVPPDNFRPYSTSYPSFWPENQKSKKYGQVFTVEYVSHNHYPNIRSWIFKINKKIVSLTELMAGVKAPSKTCQLFQLMCWPQGYKVPTSTNALVELMNMVERWRQRTDYGPVVV